MCFYIICKKLFLMVLLYDNVGNSRLIMSLFQGYQGILVAPKGHNIPAQGEAL